MSEPLLLPLTAAARHLGLKPAWLKSEAVAGRVPCLQAGAVLLFNPDALERALADRAARETAAAPGKEAQRAASRPAHQNHH